MGIFYGLAAALCWGVSDFIVTHISRKLGVLHAFFYVQLFGMLAIGALLLAMPNMPAPSRETWALAAGITLFNLVGTLLLYRAFAIGTLALVSPIASAFAVVSALLALLAGERPALLALLGALLVVGGMVAVSRGHGRVVAPGRQALRGVPEAVGVALCFGVSFWALNFVTPALGILWPVLAIRAVELVYALLWLSARRTSPARLNRATLGLAFAAAATDTLAFVAFNLGLSTAYTSIVTALASLFSAVTVLLAWAILRERLLPAQWAGVAVILCGVLLVSF